MKTKCLAATLLMVNLIPLHAAEFFILPKGDSNNYASLRDISNGATTAVGTVYNDATGVPHAAAWRRTATGYQLTVLDPSPGSSAAEAVSADGSVIVGWIYKGTRQVAVRWVDGVVDLIGEEMAPNYESGAVAVSDDGNVVACNTSAPWAEVAVWSEANGVEALENLGYRYSRATCISGDGRTVGGYHRTDNGASVAVIWNDSGAVPMPGGSNAASVMAMSRNGQVIAGYTRTGGRDSDLAEATCWDASGGVRRLGHLPGGEFSQITSSSANGEILVGTDRIKNEQVPAIWIKKQGPVSFSSYLKQKYDFELPGSVREDICVSPSGRQFGGAIFNGLSSDAWIFDTRKPKNPEISVTQPARSELKDARSTKSFGHGEVGIRGTKKTFTIKNTGNGELAGLSVALLGKSASSFEASPLRTKSLPPGASTTFSVVFKPTASGARTCTLRIKSNDADENPFDVKLSGTGISKK